MPDTITPRQFLLQQAAKWKVDPDLALTVLDQESSGVHQDDAGSVTTGDPTPYGRARGFFQLLPSTAAGYKDDAGRPLNFDDPFGNIEIGVRHLAHLEEVSQHNPRRTFALYFGGEDERQHGPKTRQYAEDVYQKFLQRMNARSQQSATATAPLTAKQTVKPTGQLAPKAPFKYPIGTPEALALPPDIYAERLRTNAGVDANGPDTVMENLRSMSRTLKRIDQGLTPESLRQGLTALRHPLQTASAIGSETKKWWMVGDQAMAEGRYKDALEAFGRAIPLFGPTVGEVFDQAKAGKGAESVGAAADIGLQLFGGELLPKTGRVQVTPRPFPPQLTPEMAEAVQAGRQAGVTSPVSVVSGSGFARKVEQAAEATPVGYVIGRGAEMRRAGQLQRWWDRLRGNPNAAVTAEEAGAGLRTGVERFIEDQHTTANQNYDAFRAREADPSNTRVVQVGTQPPPFMQPGAPRMPIMAPMQFPTDMRAVKRLFQPIVDQMMQMLPVAQRDASPGLQAMRQVLDGPDFIPASIAERNRGALGGLAGQPDVPQMRNVSQGLAARAYRELTAAIDQAIAHDPQAVQALQEGRGATAAKYVADETLRHMREEPVGAYRQATAGGDVNINHLRELQRLAPQEIPRLARAVMEELFRTAQGEQGGWTHAVKAAGQWEKLGPQTRRILFGPLDRDINNFWLLNRSLHTLANPSGSAFSYIAGTVTGIAGTAAYFAPGTMATMVAAGAGWSALMNSALGVKLLTEGLSIPAGTARAAAWTAQVYRMLEEAGAIDQRQQGQPPPGPPERATAAPPPAVR